MTEPPFFKLFLWHLEKNPKPLTHHETKLTATVGIFFANLCDLRS